MSRALAVPSRTFALRLLDFRFLSYSSNLAPIVVDHQNEVDCWVNNE
jgi:hypothetical protein